VERGMSQKKEISCDCFPRFWVRLIKRVLFGWWQVCIKRREGDIVVVCIIVRGSVKQPSIFIRSEACDVQRH